MGAFYSNFITAESVDGFYCCGDRCKCSFTVDTTGLKCTMPYVEVLAIVLKNKLAAAVGTVRQIKWSGFSEFPCCGCGTSEFGNLGGPLGMAIVLPQDIAPLKGGINASGHCRWDP